MNYTVEYAPKAERQLIELWTNPSYRAAVSLAADEIIAAWGPIHSLRANLVKPGCESLCCRLCV